MPTLLDFRRRIRSVKNTQQITRAMKFVAAARLRRAQERVFAARPYARQMLALLRSAMSRIEQFDHPLMARRPEQRLLLVVITGDRGLCGAFNANVIRRAIEFRREHPAQALEVIPIGKKGRDALRKQKWTSAGEYINISSRIEFAQAQQIAAKVMESYIAGSETISPAGVDAVYLVYNEFKTVLTQKLMVEKLLPLEPAALQGETPANIAAPVSAGHGPATGVNIETQVDYIYEQPAAEIFGRLLPRYVETQVFRAMIESTAAEHAARMTAMDSATNNAVELIDQLTLHMNTVRQAAITREIIEVVSGAASTA